MRVPRTETGIDLIVFHLQKYFNISIHPLCDEETRNDPFHFHNRLRMNSNIVTVHYIEAIGDPSGYYEYNSVFATLCFCCIVGRQASHVAKIHGTY